MALGIAGLPATTAGSGYTTPVKRPAATQSPYASSGQTGYGNTPEYLAVVNRLNSNAQRTQQSNAGNQYQNAYNYFANVAGYDPQTGTTADTNAYLNRLGIDARGNPTGGGQLGMYDANNANMGQYLQQDYASNIAANQLDAQGNQIDKSGYLRRIGAGGYYDQLGGLSDRQLANQLAGFDVQEGSSRDKFQTARRGELSDATARGALQTYGTREDLTDIDKTLMRDVMGLNVQREGAKLGTEKEKVGLTEQRAQDKDRLNQLNLEGQKYGLKADQFKTELDRGLAKLGIDKYFNAESLMDKANSASAQDRATFDQIVRNAMDYSSQFPTSSPLAKPIATRNAAQSTRMPVR